MKFFCLQEDWIVNRLKKHEHFCFIVNIKCYIPVFIFSFIKSVRKRMVDRETYLSLIIHVLNGVIAGMCVLRYEFEDLCSVSNCHLPEAATIFSYK